MNVYDENHHFYGDTNLNKWLVRIEEIVKDTKRKHKSSLAVRKELYLLLPISDPVTFDRIYLGDVR